MNKGHAVYRNRTGAVSTASGVIVDARKGYIVTAAHIARDPSFSARITTWDGRQYDARIVNVLPDEDLALLKTGPIAGGRSARLAHSTGLRRGEFVLAIGTPKRKMGVVTLGRIRLRNIGQRLDYGMWGFDNAIEISMTVEVGHSGGPVFDAKGDLIGMIAGYERRSVTKTGYRTPSITYVVPSSGIRSFLRRSIAGHGR